MSARLGSGVALLLALAGCGGEPAGAHEYHGPPIPWAYAPFPEAPAPKDNPTTADKQELGRLLFYDPVLSTDRLTACATCHSEIWGLSDGLARSVGVGGKGPTGPGRTGPNVTRRNAPTLWNVAHKQRLFWDGRSSSLEAQALEPLADPRELGRPPAEVAAELASIPAYAALFAAAFPTDAEPVRGENLARAIAAFERSFSSRRATYDRYVAGDRGALDPETIRGMELFAEAKCSSCHLPPLFDGPRFANRGVGDGSDGGRAEISGDEAERGAFAVPTLRNSRDSEPYFHDGSAQTLRDAVAHEAARSAAEGQSRELGPDEIDAITRFLDKALTDVSAEPDRPESVPSGLPVPKDGFRIPR